MIDLCTLGTGGAIPLPQRALSSLYIRVNGRGLLIDCGEGTQTQIRRLGWGFKNIDDVFITHYHCDHCGGLPGFLLSMAKTGRDTPLHLWGPPGLHRVIDGLRVVFPQLPYELCLHELPLQQTDFSLCGMCVTAFPLQHGIPCLGFRFVQHRTRAFLPEAAKQLNIPITAWKRLKSGESVVLDDGRAIHPDLVTGPERPGISFLYATDTRPVESISRLGEHTDLMILEGMYGGQDKREQALKNKHMLYREAASLAASAGTKQLVLTHFSNALEDPEAELQNARDVFPSTIAATDLYTMTLDYPTEVHEQ